MNELSPLVQGGRARTASASSAYSQRSRAGTCGTLDSVESGRERRNSYVFGLNDTIDPVVRPNITKPRYDQSTYWGRARHFFFVTSPLNVFATEAQLDEAQRIVLDFIDGKDDDPPLSIDAIWRAKQLYDSAFHPQTGQKVPLLARMSFAVYGNMLLSGCMLVYYKSLISVMFWQFMNQSYNAGVNYANRNTSAKVSNMQLLAAYLAACVTSVSVALILNHYLGQEGSWFEHFVPFFAVCSANTVNVPMMRQTELQQGISIELEDGTEVGPSTAAAKWAVLQVIPCRLLQAVPPMIFPPLLLSGIKDWALVATHPVLQVPITVLTTGVCLLISIPLACALFPQIGEMHVSELDVSAKALIAARYPNVNYVYYQKGL